MGKQQKKWSALGQASTLVRFQRWRTGLGKALQKRLEQGNCLRFHLSPQRLEGGCLSRVGPLVKGSCLVLELLEPSAQRGIAFIQTFELVEQGRVEKMLLHSSIVHRLREALCSESSALLLGRSEAGVVLAHPADSLVHRMRLKPAIV